MNDEKEFENAQLWAERITHNKQNGAQKIKDRYGNLKIAIYVLAAIAALCFLCYIIYRAYRVPEPQSILQEVNDMTNHIEAH